MEISTTSHGFRLHQHGVVLSESRFRPGPTHSVVDVLAALAEVLHPGGRTGLLGFAGGGLMAPLRWLNRATPVEAVDLEARGYKLFQEHCAGWAGPLRWNQGDAVIWLRRPPRRFDVLIDDLSVASKDDVIKPAISWDVLPRLMKQRVARHGIVISNLLHPINETWAKGLTRFTAIYPAVRVIHFDEFENRIVVAGSELPGPRELGRHLRAALRRLRSRQANRIRVSILKPL